MLAVDCGTTSTKTVLIDLNGRILYSASMQRRTYFPQPGYVEQSLDELWYSACQTCRSLASRVRKLKILGISFSGTIGDAIAIDRNLKPISQRFMLYSDTRSICQCRKLNTQIGARTLYRKTGNPLSPASCLPKWLWLKECDSSRYKRTSKLIQPKDFLVLKAAGRVRTDYVSASATMALDIERMEWSESILNRAGIDADKMPDLVEADAIMGELTPIAARRMGLRVGIPIIAGAGDTGAMMLGAGAVKGGDAVLYLGGGAEVDLATERPIFDHEMRIPSRSHAVPGMFFTSITALSSGLAKSWLTHVLALEDRVSSFADLARQSRAGANGVLFLPYLLGEQGAIWDPKATAAFIGLKASTTYEDLCRSVLESTAYSLSHILEVYRENGIKPKTFIICGGGANSSLSREIITDTLGASTKLHSNPSEVAALGAAICATVGLREYKSFQEATKAMTQYSEGMVPNSTNHKVYARMSRLANSAYPILRGLMHELNGFESVSS